MARVENSDLRLQRVGLNDLITKLFGNNKNKFYPDIVRELTSTQAYEIFLQEGDFGTPTVMNQATGMPFDDFSTPYSITVTPKKRAIAFAVSTEAIETEQGYGVISNRANKLQLAMVKGRETECANHINLATSTAAGDKGPDGKALAATDHPLDGGATQSNYGVSSSSVTLGIQNLEGMIQELRGQKSHRGDPFPSMGPYNLYVPTQLEMLARRLVDADKVPQSNDNDPNPGGRTIAKVCVNPYFTSGTAFALRSVNEDEHGLCLLVRRALRTAIWKDENKDVVNTALNEIYTKFNRGWRGFQFSPGT